MRYNVIPHLLVNGHGKLLKQQVRILLTASHNPRQWNALKLLNEHGEFLNAAEQGLFIERKEFIDNLQIKQEIITVRECRNQKVLVNKVRYALSE